jgi:hypothetical protein
MKTHNNFDERFVFEGNARTYSLIAMAIGLLAIVAGFLTGAVERTFDNLLLMGYYFACVCLSGVMFCAIQYVAQAGWSASIIRLPQAFVKVLPFAAAILFLIVLAGLNLTHKTINEEHKTVVEPFLYKEWATKGLSDPKADNYNALIAGKSSFLNQPFFYGRMVVFLAIYSLFGWLLVKYSVSEDELGGMSNYNKSFKISCIFLVIFGFTYPIFAFDTVMSLQAEWYSTMFGWYNLAAMWVSGLSVLTLVMIYVRRRGYFSWITADHLHNMGIFMFAFSIFWTYLWFCQFLLQYYANLPEEVTYFYKRWEPSFMPYFWINIAVNFLAPLLILMMRDSKRVEKVLTITAITLIIGHWLDYFMMIMPSTIGPQEHWYQEIGYIEIGVFIGFAGLFTYSVLGALSKFKFLAPKNHPFLEESLHHHI